MSKENLDKKVSKNSINSSKSVHGNKIEQDLKEKKEVVEKVEKVTGEDVSKKSSSKNKKNDDAEPTLFHYSVVLIVLGAIFLALSMGFEYYDKKTNNGVIDNPNLNIKLYKYPFKVNGIDYSIQFYNPVSDLEKSDLQVGISKEELLSTEDFKFIFSSDSSSNGEVIKVSGRLFPFLKNIYKFSLNPQEDIISSDILTCENSTTDNKLIFFNSNSSTNKVTYDKFNGCITFMTTDAKLMGTLGDKFFLEMINTKWILS